MQEVSQGLWGLWGERFFCLQVFFEDVLWRLESDNGERKTENEDYVE